MGIIMCIVIMDIRRQQRNHNLSSQGRSVSRDVLIGNSHSYNRKML